MITYISHDNLSKEQAKLLDLARNVRERSYSPYSKLKVGAVILCKSGALYSGCNVENASYSATICAERAALVAAVSDGERDFDKIAISSSCDKVISMCGICRQMFVEFSSDIEIIMGNDYKKAIVCMLSDLLPESFTLK